jgi:hypothetical protein
LTVGACEARRGIRAVRLEPGDPVRYRLTCDDQHPCPSLLIRQGEPGWDLAGSLHLAVDVTNPGDRPVLVECRPNDVRAITNGGGQTIAPGETRSVRAFILRDEYPAYIDEKLFGMFALPARPSIVRIWRGMHPGNIDRLSLLVIRPPANAELLVGNVRAEGAFAFLTEEELKADFFPFIDPLGQYRHRDWPGKTHAIEELRQADADERADLHANPAPSGRSKYGGWLNGPQRQAAGHFRTEKADGKWWLVDPDGRLFWSYGMVMGVIPAEQGTPINEREHYFAELPDPGEFPECYSERGGIPVGHYKGRTVNAFNFYAWNLRRKYGDDWRQACIRRAAARLASWGMNTCSSFSPRTTAVMTDVPVTVIASTRRARRIEGSAGYWGKFPDPFDDSFVPAIEAALNSVRRTTTDPWCVGYFIDNEMEWGDARNLGRSALHSGAGQPAKHAALRWLQARYDSVDALNAAWRTAHDSWQAVLADTTPPADGHAGDDLHALSEMIARHYFDTVKRTLARLAPHKLYLGCRFHDHYYPDEDTTCDWVVKLAAEYCDVVSFNRYRYSAVSLRPADADVPVIIGEWHMGALDRGLFHYTLRFAESQQHRAELFGHYLTSCLDNPFIVGAHWFQYVDEPTTGRFDGENFQTGLVDICDRPYDEMIRAARQVGRRTYEQRR